MLMTIFVTSPPSGASRVARMKIEIWFAIDKHTLYMLSGGCAKADWVKNLQKNPQVRVRLGDELLEGRAWVVTDKSEDSLARRIVVAKYQPRDTDDLTEWGRTSLAVAVGFS